MSVHRAKSVSPRLVNLVATRATKPVKIDGRLDDTVWRQARAYPLNLSLDAQDKGQRIQEPGVMRLAWDEHALYLGVDFTDSAVVAV
ncbi:MAG: sugar-binding protein, partial [Kiritimatiellae bacterium]|nr:sugar-binding protein [Kiritimatiellia bacterium]